MVTGLLMNDINICAGSAVPLAMKPDVDSLLNLLKSGT